jgi:hypothetical protein
MFFQASAHRDWPQQVEEATVATFVDVSASQLDSAAVLRLIRHHTEHRGAESIFFKVDKPTFDAFADARPHVVEVSPEEASTINAFLGASCSTSDYTLDREIACAGCGRRLTFYDVFETGRGKHGDDHLRRFMAGGDYHIQALPKDFVLDVTCSNCGAVNHVTDCPSYESRNGY